MALFEGLVIEHRMTNSVYEWNIAKMMLSKWYLCVKNLTFCSVLEATFEPAAQEKMSPMSES